MQIFHIPTTVLLDLFLIFSTEIREFCRFYKSIPDESFFSRFKIAFENDIADLFNSMVPRVIDICEKINFNLPNDSPYKDCNSMLIFDTSGLKPRIKENNSKTFVAEINKQKAYAKATHKENYNPYAAAYVSMPKYAEANPSIRLDFVNGHFGYFYKFGLLTNDWGIPLNIKFFEDDFYKSVGTSFDTPDEQKYFYGNASLKPVIIPFLEGLKNHSDFKFKTFLGDSEFDSYDNFSLLKHLEFEEVFIPPNPHNQGNCKIGDLEYNTEGIPLCPLTKDPFKANPWIESPRTINTSTMRADLYLTTIVRLINIILAYAINKHEYIRSINKLFKIAA